MKQYYFLLLLLFSFFSFANAQESSDSLIQMQSTDFQYKKTVADAYPNLSKTFYTNSSFLRHTYDYDLTDKKRRLKMISKDLRGASLLAIMASTATMIWVGEANDWSLAVSIPSAFALATATFIPLFLISSHIAKKAERLEVQTVMLSSLNSHTQIGLARFFDDNYLGFSIKTTF